MEDKESAVPRNTLMFMRHTLFSLRTWVLVILLVALFVLVHRNRTLDDHFIGADAVNQPLDVALQASTTTNFQNRTSHNSQRSSCNSKQCADCNRRVSEARAEVNTEIRKNIRSLPKCTGTDHSFSRSCQKCKPRLIKVLCNESLLTSSKYKCTRNIVIEEYDLVSQHDCILAISQSAERFGTTKIPRIAYSNYFYNGAEMRFYEHLSVLSLVRHLKPSVYFFLNDGLPSGRWWLELLVRLQRSNIASVFGSESIDSNYTVKFYSIFRSKPTAIYGNKVWKGDQQSDVARLESLLLYGGVYIDLDAFAIRDLDVFLNYSWVMGYERLKDDASRGWLDHMSLLNNGVLLAERDAPFGVLWHHSYKSFYGGELYAQHGIIIPHSLAESCPHLIHCEQRSFNFPNNINTHLLYGDGIYFDLSRNYFVHSWFAQNKRVVNPETILRMNTTMGRVWRYLYFAEPSL